MNSKHGNSNPDEPRDEGSGQPPREAEDSISQRARRDSRVKEFYRRAAPILASERGWNERSQLKLKAVAQDLKLPEPLYEQAIRKLKSAAADWTRQLSRYERLFVKKVKSQMAWQSTQVFDSRLETKFVKIGVQEFQLSPGRARELLRRVADDLGMSRVSYSEAEEHVRQLIASAIGNSTFVANHTVQRLIGAGKQWGVDAGRVRLLVEAILEDNQLERQRRSSWGLRSVAALASLVVMGLLIFLAWRLSQSGQGSSTMHSDTVNSDRVSGGLPQPTRFPEWWSQATIEAFNRVDNVSVEILLSLDSTALSSRRSAYRSLINDWFAEDTPLNPQREAFLLGLLSDEHSRAKNELFAALAQVLTHPPALPRDIRPMANALEANRFLTACYQRTTDENERAAIDYAVETSLGTPVDMESGDYLPWSNAILSRAAWRLISAHAADQPVKATRLMAPLAELTAPYLDQQEQQERELAAVMQIVESTSANWRLLIDVLSRVVRDATPAQSFEILELITSTTDESLANWLTGQLALKLEIPADEVTRDKLLDGIRRNMALSSSKTPERLASRWERLRKAASTAIADSNRDARDPSPQMIARVAHYATLAFILNHAQDTGDWSMIGHFDRAIEQSPRNLGIRSVDHQLPKGMPQYGRISRRAMPSNTRTRDDSIDKLSRFQSLDPQVRAIAFQRLCDVASRFPDITSREARYVASYLLNARETPDLLAFEKSAGQLGHWAHLTLAIADELPNTDCPVDHAMTVVGLVTGKHFALSNKLNWREALQLALLEYVSAGLLQMAEQVDDESSHQWNELNLFLYRQYQTRCVVKKVDGSRINTATSTFDLAALLTGHLSETSSMTTDQVNTIRRTLKAIPYSGQSLLHQFATAQLQLIQVLRGEGAPGPPEGDNVKTQLLLNELWLLRHWLLTSE